MRWIAVVAVILLGGAVPGHAQILDPDNRLLCWNCYGHNEHFEAGMVVDLAVRSPFVDDAWRRSPWKRVALVGVTAVAYEGLDYAICRRDNKCGLPDRGFGVIDVFYAMAGAAATELVMAGVHRIFR